MLSLVFLLAVYAPLPAQAMLPPPGSCTPTADFHVGASPPTLILPPSSTGNSTVTLTPIDGFSGTVTLATINLDSDLTLSISQTTLDLSSGPQASNITVTTSRTIPTGDHFFQVNATTTGTLFHEITITVKVPTRGIRIDANKSFLTIPQPNSDTFDIKVTSLYGFSGIVNQTATFPPFFYRPTSTPPIVSPRSVNVMVGVGAVVTTTFTISTTLSTTPDTYVVDVSGKSSLTVSNFTSVIVTVTGPDFSIDAQPSDLVVPPGSSQTSTLNVTSILNFGGTVTFSWSVSGFSLPLPKANVSPLSVPVSPGSSAKSTLTVITPLGTMPGDYSVNINGTSGSRIRSVSVLVIVPGPPPPPVPGFSITPSPGVLTVKQGGSSNSSTLTLKSLNLFVDIVDLSLFCSPEGLTASVSPTSVSLAAGGTQQSTLTVSASSFTVPGLYDIGVDGFGMTTSTFNSTSIEVLVTGPHFDLSASPFIIPLTVGSTTASTITATSALGFTGTVKLTSKVFTFPGSPTGLTVSLSPTSLDLTTAPSATSTLTLTANAVGFYIVEVSGTSWPLANMTSILVDVTVPVPDFSLHANPPSLTIAQGTSQKTIIYMKPVNGFTGPVLLSPITSDPSITASPIPKSISSSTNSTLTVNVASNAASGLYTIDVTGTSGSLIHDVIIPISVPAPLRSTSTNVSCSGTIAVGSATPCTVTVMDTSSGASFTPTGSFSLNSNSTTSMFSGPCILSGTGASASCMVSYTPAETGDHRITANYPGDIYHTGSSGFTDISAKHPTKTSVACDSPVVVSQPSTCKATVTDTLTSGITTPSGIVTFALSGSYGTPSCSLAAGSVSGTATCTIEITPSATGSIIVTASYGGDSTRNASTSPSTTINVNPRSTKTSVTCATPVAVNQASQCTATVNDDSTAGTPITPGGTVSFTGPGAATSLSCSLAASANLGTATCVVSFTPSAYGSVTVTGSYGGDTTHKVSTSTPTTITVNYRSTTTSVSCDSPVTVNAPSTCRATVKDVSAGTPIVPTGLVSLVSTGALGTFSGSPCTLTPETTVGTASCTVIFTPSASGTASVTGTYAGSTVHSGSGSTPTSVTVGIVSLHGTTTSISCQSPVAISQPSTCTVTVTDSSTTGATTPSGTVSLTPTGAGALSATSCTLSSGNCQVSFTGSGIGSATLTGSYGGDGSHSGSNSNTATILVIKRSSATAVSCASPVVVGQSTKCTATVTDTSPGTSTSPSGTVSFASTGAGSLSATSCTLSAGSCYVNFTPSSAETVTITATYEADSAHDVSTSTAASITVNSSPSPVSPAPTIFGLDPTVFYGIVAGVVAAVAVGAGATIFLRRRKP